MTTTELNKFRSILTSKRNELAKENHGRGALAVEPCPDELDRIQLGQERDLAIDTLDRNAKLQRAVRAALARIDRGTFGICIECEETISMKRLAAVPWTASCIACQEAADSVAGQPWSAGEELLASAG
ncbi:MAG TPA: TraR/DksA family transcriptional regulator [Bryobacteraceae bacterium]|nr:TraR/DksA family transcriptional regulator [Bryobacteraceae bacterium]